MPFASKARGGRGTPILCGPCELLILHLPIMSMLQIGNFFLTIRSEGDWQWGTQSAFTIDPPSGLIGQQTKSILTGRSFVSVALSLRRLQKEVAQPWISFIKQLKLSSTLKTGQAPKRICCVKSWSLQKSELRIWKPNCNQPNTLLAKLALSLRNMRILRDSINRVLRLPRRGCVNLRCEQELLRAKPKTIRTP